VPPGAAGAAKAAALSIAVPSPASSEAFPELKQVFLDREARCRDVNLSSRIEKIAPSRRQAAGTERGGSAGSAEEVVALPGCSIRTAKERDSA
jgi:hypothetical protein